MIIKIIPEKNETHIKAVEHHNVKEFLIFGNKKDEDGELIDFHDWTGQYRYLIGSLNYFYQTLCNEHMNRSNATPSISPSSPQGLMKQVKNDYPELQVIDTEVQNDIHVEADAEHVDAEQADAEQVVAGENIILLDQ